MRAIVLYIAAVIFCGRRLEADAARENELNDNWKDS